MRQRGTRPGGRRLGYHLVEFVPAAEPVGQRGIVGALVDGEHRPALRGEDADGRRANAAGGTGDQRDSGCHQAPNVRLNPGGITMSPGVRSPAEDRPRPSRAESMPPRMMSSTFSTPAWPFAARPHR